MKKQYNEIIGFLKKYQEETNCKGYVIGISGGKDSTVVAKLLVDAIGKENVLGILMPNGEQKDIKDSINVCELLDIDYTIIDIEDSYRSIFMDLGIGSERLSTHYFETEYGEVFEITEKAKTNIAPRIRMTVLYSISQSLGYRVAGTGNRSEQFIGWFTKWGDGACDINPIAHLTCTEVIELGDFLELPKHLIHKTPADGLTGKSDEDNFGFSYQMLDDGIRNGFSIRPGFCKDLCEEQTIRRNIHRKIVQLHDNSRHKFAPITINNYD